MDSNMTNTNEILAVEELKEKLYTDINESGLSIVSIYYIMKYLMNEIIVIYNRELKKLKDKEETPAEVVKGEVE